MDRRTLLTATHGTGLAARIPRVAARPARAPARIGWLTAQLAAELFGAGVSLPMVQRAAVPIGVPVRSDLVLE